MLELPRQLALLPQQAVHQAEQHQLDTVLQRIATLERRNAELEEQLTGAGLAATLLAEAEQRPCQLREELATTRQQLASSEALLSAARQRIAQLESQLETQAAETAASMQLTASRRPMAARPQPGAGHEVQLAVVDTGAERPGRAGNAAARADGPPMVWTYYLLPNSCCVNRVKGQSISEDQAALTKGWAKKLGISVSCCDNLVRFSSPAGLYTCILLDETALAGQKWHGWQAMPPTAASSDCQRHGILPFDRPDLTGI